MAIMAQNGLGMVENQALALRYMQALPRRAWASRSMALGSCTCRANVWNGTVRRR